MCHFIYPSGRARNYIAAEGATPRNRSGIDQVIMIVKNRLRIGNLESAGIESATEGADGIEEQRFRNLSGKKDRGVRSSMRDLTPFFEVFDL